MKLLAAFVLLPTVAFASGSMPCTFVVGHGTQIADRSAGPASTKPEWFVVTGNAAVVVTGTTLTARLFDRREDGKLSHTLVVKLPRVIRQGKDYQASVSAVLTTMNTDGGDELLRGSMVIARDSAAAPGSVWQSLVVQSSNSFAGIACYGRNAA